MRVAQGLTRLVLLAGLSGGLDAAAVLWDFSLGRKNCTWQMGALQGFRALRHSFIS